VPRFDNPQQHIKERTTECIDRVTVDTCATLDYYGGRALRASVLVRLVLYIDGVIRVVSPEDLRLIQGTWTSLLLRFSIYYTMRNMWYKPEGRQHQLYSKMAS
jgi:hypothetical protein